MERLQQMRPALFREPLLAQPAEVGGVHASRYSYPRDDDDREQHDDDAGSEQHKVLAAVGFFRRRAILTRGGWAVCALLHRGPTPVHFGAARLDSGAYSCRMQLVSVRTIIATVWVTAVPIAGIGSVHSFPGWIVLAGIALLPPLFMMRLWAPRQTLSQTIQEARR